MMKKYRHTKQPNTERVGFYIALSVCMMAVGLAVWSAYSTFNDYQDESDGSYFSSLSAVTNPVERDLSGVTEADTEAPTTAPTKAATEAATTAPTAGPDGKRGFVIYENAGTEGEDAADTQGELSSLQAVLRVTDSLNYPVKSRSVVKQYSEDAVYNATLKDYRAHTGCDFDAEVGESVYAMCAGTVKNISVSELYGVILEVDCRDFSVYYCGLDPDISLEKGNELVTGDTVGKVGVIPSESADPSHIHIEIRVGDKLIDPLSVIDNNE